MQYIQINQVIVPENRQRQEFNKKKLEELCDSIQKPIGLLQPIVLREDKRTLVCGERRLRCFNILNGNDEFDTGISGNAETLRHNGEPISVGSIPFVTLDSLSPEDLVEAELEENVRRADLTWQEQAAATKLLHDHRLQRNPRQTIKDTADELHDGNSAPHEQSEVSDLLILAEFLDDPLVGAAKDLKQARKALKEERKRVKRKILTAEFDAEASHHDLRQESCYEYTGEARFDVIITDPPYGIDAHLKDTFDSDRHEYDDSDGAFTEVCKKLPAMSFRLASDAAHLYCFCDIRRFTELFVAFELSGWTVWNRPLIWDKGNTGSYGNSDYGFRACYEAILFARKGDRKFDALHRDVINIPQKTNTIHPASKPIELYVELLKRSAFPGDRVADFFAGSGPIFPAATDVGCVATGWEINPNYIELCQERLMK